MKIVEYPAPVLRKKAEEVSEVDDELRAILDQMLTAMYEANGIGLAGPQVNISKRITVIDLGEGDPPLKLINPKIISSSGSISVEEGCLSIPDIKAKVTRAAEVKVEALNELGEKIEIEAEDLLAVCLQHEMDHLDGVLFVDRVSGVKKQMVQSQLKKLK